jgi:N-methylhydantoinase A
MIRAATDVGGTFTDLVYFSTDPETGRQTIVTGKSDTTPPDFERGVMDVLHRSGVALADIAFLAHGTTIVINALTERKGVKTGLITTEGFRDSLEIARGNRPDFFNLHYEKPAPFVPRHLRREVGGRMGQTGHERAPLVLDALPGILADFREQGVQAVAICLLHSYANPAHELAVLERVRELEPALAVAASHQISREWREYERTSTTVLSAYVQPVAERYLGRLADRLGEEGFGGQLYIMQSNCGVDSVAKTKDIPITMVESGPSSGFWAAAQLGRLIGEPNVLALDIGGTTAKCSLIEGGEVRIVSDYWIERSRRSAGYPIQLPVVDLVEIGNGGGSIAWVDDFGKLHVGPQSAGAQPGPASYGRGGTAVTTTDANLALGRINPENFRGGETVADMDAVERALGELARGQGVEPVEAARGVVRIANNNMINALKLVSVNRGYDPRDFTLVAFGGGGGMHAVALATELGMRRVVIPFAADVFSAWGMLMSDLRRDYFVTRLARLEPESAQAIDGLLREVTDGALAQFEDEGVDAEQVRFLRYGKLRYENQEHSVEVALPDGPIDAAAVAEITDAFHASYEREYTYRLDHRVEFVGTHVVAIAEVGKLTPAPLPAATRSLDEARAGRRSIDFATEGIHESDVYTGELLEPGMRFQGPAIVEAKGSTIVIHPGNEVSIDDYGNVIIELGGDS